MLHDVGRHKDCFSELRDTMPVEELDLRAHMIREQLIGIKSAPDDKSLNQVKEELIQGHLQEVADHARLLALQEEIYAVGNTPEEAVLALARFKGWGEVGKIDELDGGDPKYTWGRRFTAGGTGMKAAGWSVPGGFVLTWWK
jgi:hypothetical protein